MTDCFRWVLRSATREDHARVDRLISDLDISERSGLACFLEIHLTCFEAMERGLHTDNEMCRTLGSIRDRIDADLAALGVRRSVPRRSVIEDIDPLALEYMLAGSRLGTRVLKARWDMTEDPDLRRAGAYFSMPADPHHWQDVCRRLSLIPVDSPRATRIVTDTRRLFRLFFDVGHRVVATSAPEEMAAQ